MGTPHHHHHDGVIGRLRSVLRPHSHDAAGSIDPALEGSTAGIHALKVSLVVLSVTAIAQLAVVLISGSVGLLADTVHNAADALTAVPLWVAFAIGRRARTRRYTYGYGHAEDLAGLIIVAAIALSAVVAGIESVRRLVDQRPVTNLGVVILAGLIGFAGNEVVAAYRIRVGRRIGSAALVTDGLHARTDGITSLAVVAGAIGVLAGYPLADPIVGLLITVAILAVLRGAARDIYRRVMDAVDPRLVDAAEASLRSVPGVRDVEDLRLRWIGHRIRAETDLAVDGRLTLAEAHRIAHEAQHRLLHDLPGLADATVHVSPAAGAGVAAHETVAHHGLPSILSDPARTVRT
jgi:cation diffusion facilitator family transporter